MKDPTFHSDLYKFQTAKNGSVKGCDQIFSLWNEFNPTLMKAVEN